MRPGGRCQRLSTARRQADFDIRRFPSLAYQLLDVVDEVLAHVNPGGILLQRCQGLGCHLGRYAFEHSASVLTGDELAFVFRIRIAEGETHQEPVELRFR
jgi:hypothetical protein